MQIDLQKLFQIAPYQFRNEAEFLKCVLELKELFNLKRENITQYVLDEKQVSAYLGFYFSTYLPKMRVCWDLLGEDFEKHLNDLALIDVGAGPGTLFCALSERIKNHELVAIESAQAMIQVGRQCAEVFGLKVGWNKSPSRKRVGLFFTHSLNEMGVHEAVEYVDAYNPEQIIVIEPGTKESFQKVLDFREQMIQRNFVINYPCQTESNCPVANQDDWCHQIIKVKQTDELERICQKLKIDRRIQPVTLHWYSKRKEEQKSIIFRVHKETKFSFEWDICQNNNIQKIQIMKKDYSKKLQKELGSYTPGQKIQFEVVKEFQGVKRIKVLLP